MSLSRRQTLALIGGGTIVAATAALGVEVTRRPTVAVAPWDRREIMPIRGCGR